MLFISRRIGESIKISDDIALTVLDIDGYQVRFGIKAPREVPTDREEVKLKKEKEQEPSR